MGMYIEICRGMYGLPQAGLLANQLLANCLAPHGNHEQQHTPGLWRDHSCPITFALVVDDLLIKYTGKEHAQHLLAVLKEDHEVSVDWEAQRFCASPWNGTTRHVLLLHQCLDMHKQPSNGSSIPTL